MKAENRAVPKPKPRISFMPERPAHFIRARDTRLGMVESTMAAVRQKVAIMKKKVLLPKRMNMSLRGMTLKNGSRVQQSRVVIARGRASLIHRMMADSRMAMALRPSRPRPAGAGTRTEAAIRIAHNPIQMKDFFCAFCMINSPYLVAGFDKKALERLDYNRKLGCKEAGVFCVPYH